jgi:hypothetical protein
MVTQLVEALRYKPEGHRFDSCTMALGSTQPLTEMRKRNTSGEGVKGGRCIGLTALPLSCAECLEIWEPQPPVTLEACPGLYKDIYQQIRVIYFHKNRIEFVNIPALLHTKPRWITLVH